MKKWIIGFGILFYWSFNGIAQDYGWWNELVKWDGHTPWPEYLKLSSSGLGPNALPVPEFYPLPIGKRTELQSSLRYHHHKGDPTFDIRGALQFDFAERIAFRIFITPFEYYRTDLATRDARKIRAFDPKGWANGDLYFGTSIQIIKENKNRPNLILSAHTKTASGNGFEAGRVTETPGYYFDLLVSKSLPINSTIDMVPYFSGGIYVYQTYDNLHFQNDAFLYGTGVVFIKQEVNLRLELAGYSGYLDIGDRPVVFRINYRQPLRPDWAFIQSFQFGLRDFPYQTISTGIHYIW